MNALRATPRAAVAAGGAVLVLIAIVIAAVLALRSGSPACFAGDPKSPSPAADPALYAGAVPVKGSTQLSIDMARGELLGARTRIEAEPRRLIEMSGWGVDSVAKRAAAAVLMRVDDAPPVRADTCGNRPDVASFFHTDAYAKSGFVVRVQAVPGSHRLAFDVLSADRKTLYRDVRSIQLDVKPEPVGATPAVQGGFTYLDGAVIPDPVFAGTPFAHRAATDLRISGWLVDQTRRVPTRVRSVDVLVDGKLADHASYGQRRPDVATFVQVPDLTNAGFTARVFTDDLRPGRHVLTLRAVVADGRTATFGTRIVLDLTRPQ